MWDISTPALIEAMIVVVCIQFFLLLMAVFAYWLFYTKFGTIDEIREVWEKIERFMEEEYNNIDD